MDDFEIELKNDFLNEAKDLVQTTEASFLELEKNPGDEALIDLIFRFAHNLKGTSRAVGFGQIAELTHVAENILLKIKKKEISVTEKVVSGLLSFNDQVRNMVDGLSENIEREFDNSEILEELRSIEVGETSAVSAEVAPVEDLTDRLSAPPADLFAELQEESFEAQVEESFAQAMSSVAQSPVQVENIIPLVIEKKSPVVEKTEMNKQDKREKKEDETIRVSLGRLEKLANSVGELVILQAAVERALTSRSEDIKTGQALSKLCKDIQELSMSIRMVPLAGTFQKLQRTVRDTSRSLEKKIDLQIIGEETEIDRTVLEHLGDPLVHLIRNAIDHGVETPEERLKAGKAESGIVEVMACHEGNFLVIQITDDGKGMDTDRLRAKAIERGILKPGQNISEQEALNLIFHAGFSTKEQVSEVSGRGVGMDVVKTNIESLGGEIRIQSKLGVGSCFRLMVPLTLAIIDGMILKCGEQLLIIPRNQIHEINRYDVETISYAGEKTPFYTLRNEVLPVFDLGNEVGSNSKEKNILLVVRVSGSPFAIVVEDVIRQQQVVVKPPTAELHGRLGMMGTTILGDGKPAIIFDLVALYGKKSKKQSQYQVAA